MVVTTFATFARIFEWSFSGNQGKEPNHQLNEDQCVSISTLKPIVWCYVWYYVWHYVWYDVWLNIVINKFVLLLSEIMVTWIFGNYHIVHEMHSMWFMWKVTEYINHKFFVNSEFSS